MAAYAPRLAWTLRKKNFGFERGRGLAIGQWLAGEVAARWAAWSHAALFAALAAISLAAVVGLPDRPTRKGMSAKLEYEYKRHGTMTLHGLMHVNTGRVNGFCLPRRTNQDTAMTLRVLFGLLLMQGYHRITVIMDQLNTHMSMNMVSMVAELCGIPIPDDSELDTRHKRHAFLESENHRIRFQFTPRHASWLDPIEKWFSILVRRLLRRGTFTSTEQLASRITEFIDYYNRHLAHPYRYRRRSYGDSKSPNCSPVQGAET